MSLRPQCYIFLCPARQGNHDPRGVSPEHHKDAWSHRDILKSCEKYEPKVNLIWVYATFFAVRNVLGCIVFEMIGW